MESTPRTTRGVIVSASSPPMSTLENILLGQYGTYYSDITGTGKVLGLLSQSSDCLTVSIEQSGDGEVSLQTFITTFRPHRTFSTKSVQECRNIIDDLQKSHFCSGIREEIILPYLSSSESPSLPTSVFLVERLGEAVVYRNRKCSYLTEDVDGSQCELCRELLREVSQGEGSGGGPGHEQTLTDTRHDGHNTEAPLHCPFCEVKFDKQNISRLRSHLRKSHRDKRSDPSWRSIVSAEKLELTCCFCGKHYSSLSCLEQHERLMHSDQVEMESCHICGKVFKKGGSTLWGHMKTHEDGGHVCTVCGAKFKVKSYLQRHMRSHDPEGKKYSCLVCGEKFTRPYLMRQHQEFTHNKNLPFKCEMCGKKLRSNTFLKIHMRSVHSKEKPFPCEVCGFRSSRVDNLNIHRTKVHHLSTKITRTQLQKLVSEGKHPFCSNPEDIPEY